MKFLLLTLLLATTLTAQPIVIRAARVIDGRGHVMTDVAVVVEGGKIVRIVPDAKTLKDVTIDLGDRTLMPGGVDTHVHIGWHFDAKDGRSHDD
jgi:imidazolonepropionase-like amidohydrolase